MNSSNNEEKASLLMHQVFKQTDNGRELLEIFKHRLMFVPIDRHGTDPFMLGKEEGERDFIRKILLTIETIEND